MFKIPKSASLVFVLSILTGCVATRVTRTSTKEITDLSGRWNDVDSRLVAEAMIEDFTSAPWLSRFHQEHAVPPQQYGKRKPVIIVSTILNKSHEHIEPDTFIKDIERAIIHRGEVRIVANSTFKEKLRSERASQTDFVSPETQKQFGRELGADYMVFGTINTIVDTEGKNKVIFYQINLELANLETNELVWIGDKKIKKYIGRGSKIKKKYRGAAPAAHKLLYNAKELTAMMYQSLTTTE